MGRKNHGANFGAKVLIAVNILFLAACLAIIIAGAVLWSDLKEIRDQADVLKDLNLDVLVQVVIFSAVALFVVAVIGIIAAVKKLKKLMVFYVVLIFVLLTIELSMGILMIVMNKSDVRDSFREDSLIGAERRRDFEDYMECCGWDYITQEFFPERVACIARNPTFTTSCGDKVQSIIDDTVRPTAIILLVLSCFSFIGLIAAIVFIVSQKKKKEDFFENPFSF